MKELIDVLTIEGNPTGDKVSKLEVHQKGYYHNTAHIWFYNKNGNVLLQQRSAKKTFFPLLWDVSVAGHVDSGESIRQAAVRETREEIGLFIFEHDLKKIGVFESFKNYDNGYIDNEFHNTFISETEIELSELIPHPDEVESLKFISIEEFENLLEHIGQDQHFVPNNKEYYEFVLIKIKESLNLI